MAFRLARLVCLLATVAPTALALRDDVDIDGHLEASSVENTTQDQYFCKLKESGSTKYGDGPDGNTIIFKGGNGKCGTTKCMYPHLSANLKKFMKVKRVSSTVCACQYKKSRNSRGAQYETFFTRIANSRDEEFCSENAGELPHEAQLCWQGYSDAMARLFKQIGKDVMTKSEHWTFQCVEQDGHLKSKAKLTPYPEAVRKVSPKKKGYISGKVVDAQDPDNIVLAGADVKLTYTRDTRTGPKTIEKTTKTNDEGIYKFSSVWLGFKLSIEASHSDYSTSGTSFTVVGMDVDAGQQADISLRKIMQVNSWSAVMEWEDESDMDIELTLPDEDIVDYNHDSYGDEHDEEEVDANLDVDNQKGYGPETITINKANKCKDSCEFVIRVNLYSSSSEDKKTKVHVKLFNGDHLVKLRDVELDPKDDECGDQDCWKDIFKFHGSTKAVTEL